MTKTYAVDGMTCVGCAATVERALSGVQGVSQVNVSLPDGNAQIVMTDPIPLSAFQGALKNHSYQLHENGQKTAVRSFWADLHIWKRASFNTLNCLAGCSIGDFGMVLYLQAYHPRVSMSVQMVMATLAGLGTSIMLETLLLHAREKFAWSLAFRTALSMSFLSMVAMEIAMNTTDFMITGGKAAFVNPMYWTALLLGSAAGFMVPLPYNYYKLKKFDKACH